MKSSAIILLILVLAGVVSGCIGSGETNPTSAVQSPEHTLASSTFSVRENPEILADRLFVIASPKVKYVHVTVVHYENGSAQYVAVMPEGSYEHSGRGLSVNRGEGLYYEVSQSMGVFFWRVYPLKAPFNVKATSVLEYSVDSLNWSSVPAGVRGFYDFVMNVVEPALSSEVRVRIASPHSVPYEISEGDMEVVSGRGIDLARSLGVRGYYYVNLTTQNGTDLLRGYFFGGSIVPVMAGFLMAYGKNGTAQAFAIPGDCRRCVSIGNGSVSFSQEYPVGMPVILMEVERGSFR